MEHKAGFVSILGNPNVGKSTLMNALTDEKLSIITSKAQTTRHRITGIVNGDDFQIVYSDTPGILRPSYKMQECMMKYVENALQDSDIILYVVEVKERKYIEEVINKIKKLDIPVVLIVNKIDTADENSVKESLNYWKTVIEPTRYLCVSAIQKIGLEKLIDYIVELLPNNPPYFPKDELTDRPMRFFVSEIIREKILLQFKKEIPYSVQIEIDSYKVEENITRIEAIIYVERDSQKGIILGYKGEAIKKLGISAREAIEEFIGQKVFLSLTVKVYKNWRNNDRLLQMFGYKNQSL